MHLDKHGGKERERECVSEGDSVSKNTAHSFSTKGKRFMQPTRHEANAKRCNEINWSKTNR